MDGRRNAEQEMKDRGARYEPPLMPIASNVVVNGRLVTGQNTAIRQGDGEASGGDQSGEAIRAEGHPPHPR